MAGGRAWATVALLVLGAAASAKVALEYEPEIGVPNGGPWGIWAWWETCPEDTYATGFSLKVEPYEGIGNDDTALNGVRLFCTSGGRGEKHEGHAVESQSGIWGRWSEAVWCPRGSYLVRFSLRTERPKAGLHDDMGATNIRFACSGGEILEGHGLSWGEYDGWSPSCHKGLCGIQTKQEPLRGALRDDTALNDVRFRCCKR